MAVNTTMAGEGADAPLLVATHDLTLRDLRMTAYEQVNLALEQGRAHAVCAQDKGGKTELLLTLAGRMRPSAGTGTVAGCDLTTEAGLRSLRKLTSLAFFDHVNDVERVLRVRTIASAELGLAGRRSGREATMAFLEEWGLAELAESNIEDLSRYDYDRLGIALAMVHEPRLLLVDDIERDLTEHESRKLCQMLKDLASQGTTVICAVFDYDLAVRFDTVSCITSEARAQRDAWRRKHQQPGKVA